MIRNCYELASSPPFELLPGEDAHVNLQLQRVASPCKNFILKICVIIRKIFRPIVKYFYIKIPIRCLAKSTIYAICSKIKKRLARIARRFKSKRTQINLEIYKSQQEEPNTKKRYLISSNSIRKRIHYIKRLLWKLAVS